jgi:hypothetical protein
MVIDLSKKIDEEFSVRDNGLYVPNTVVLDSEIPLQRSNYFAKVLAAAVLVGYSFMPASALAQSVDPTHPGDEVAVIAPEDNDGGHGPDPDIPSDQSIASVVTMDDILFGMQAHRENLRAATLRIGEVAKGTPFGVRAAKDTRLDTTVGAILSNEDLLAQANFSIHGDDYNSLQGQLLWMFLKGNALKNDAQRSDENNPGTYPDGKHKLSWGLGLVGSGFTESVRDLDFEHNYLIKLGLRGELNAGTNILPGISNSVLVLEALSKFGGYSTVGEAAKNKPFSKHDEVHLDGYVIRAAYLFRLGDTIYSEKYGDLHPGDESHQLALELFAERDFTEFDGVGLNYDDSEHYGAALIVPLRHQLAMRLEGTTGSFRGRADDLLVPTSGTRSDDASGALIFTYHPNEKLYFTAGVHIGGLKDHPEHEVFGGLVLKY